MSIMSYKPKGSTVRAVKNDGTPETIEEIVSWCSGKYQQPLVSGDMGTILVPTLEGVLTLNHGQYLCRTRERGFFIVDGEAFVNNYEPVKGPVKRNG